jgi:S-adenosyl methyltransferase
VDGVADSVRDEFPPHGVDLLNPSPARVYDFLLGGDYCYEADRRFGEQALRVFPKLRAIARANRLFLHRVVRYLLRRGVRQFVDIGAGLPTMGHTHQVADVFAPGESKVVYVDHEPVTVAHSRVLLDRDGDEKRHAAVHADLRDPDRLWQQVAATGVVDLHRPVAVLLIAVLHLRQFDSRGVDIGPRAVARYRELSSPGSYLAISHLTDEGVPIRAKLAGFAELAAVWRSKQEVEALFGDFELVEPGLVGCAMWRPGGPGDISDAPDMNMLVYGGVGRKPH